jgi:hypothetical protein
MKLRESALSQIEPKVFVPDDFRAIGGSPVDIRGRPTL